MVPLERSKLFGGLTPAEASLLQAAAQTLEFAAGDVIFREGDQGDGVYVIREGVVKVSALVSQGDLRILSHLREGEYFGEMAVIDKERRSASVTAEEDSVVYFIPADDMMRVLEGSPRLAVGMVREFSLRMREFNKRYLDEVLQAERLTLVGRFARSIVHDFKNPLNVIGIAADMAGMEDANQAMRQMAKVRIRKQVDRLSNMINELLEFTRGSQSSIIPAPSDYGAFVSTLIEEMRVEIADKKIPITFDNKPPSVCILFDPRRLTHVFYNLIHNAIDAMPDGGRINIKFSVTNDDVVTEIKDSGNGIAPEILPRLFEAFATYGKSHGTGLGLSICRRIIEDHHGQVQARNAPEGGAAFSFTLPRKI